MVPYRRWSTNLRLKILFVLASFSFLWSIVPGRSPSFFEELLLTPFIYTFVIPAGLIEKEEISNIYPRKDVKEFWYALKEFEKKSTKPKYKGLMVPAQVLGRFGKGGGGRHDWILVSLKSYEKVGYGYPCVVRNVLVGFTSPPSSNLPKIQGKNLVWVRLLNSRKSELRLEAVIGKKECKGIIAPARIDDRFPLRLLHPASLDPIKKGSIVYSISGLGFYRHAPKNYIIGWIEKDPWMLDILFVETWYRPEFLHHVYILLPGIRSINKKLTTHQGPFYSGNLIPVKILKIPDSSNGVGPVVFIGGKNIGIERKSAAVMGWSLVGIANSVGPYHGRLSLVGGEDFKLRVLIGKPASKKKKELKYLKRGIILASELGSNYVKFKPYGSTRSPEKGDIIWTAPDGLNMPEGIFVGRISSIEKRNGSIHFLLDRPWSGLKIPRRIFIFRFGYYKME